MSLAVKITDLEWRYEFRKSFALRGINLEIEENTFLGIVGANENGKTTLVSAISGLIPHSFNGIYRGEVEIFGQKVMEMNALELATKVGFVFADPESQFTAMTVEEEIVFGLENMGFTNQEIGERIKWAAEMTMIEDLLDKSPYDVSGGQKQRVVIAAVLAVNPPIIIMDEPTSMIDPLGKRGIFNILKKLKDAGEHTLIVIEHNIEQLAPLSDQLLLMNEGKIAKLTNPKDFFNDPEILEEQGVLTPESTEFIQWLKSKKYIPENTVLPLDLDTAIDISRQALHSGSNAS